MVPEKLLVIDTETGGIGFKSSERCAIIQLGAVVWDITSPEIDFATAFEVVIKDWHGDMDADALRVNGFTEERIKKEGVSPIEAVCRFERFLGEHFGRERPTLCGHNIGYDVQYLARLYRLAGVPNRVDEVFNYRTLDTASIARFLIMAGLVPLQKPDSKSLFEHFQCEPLIPHDALSDAVATHKLLTRMLNLLKVWSHSWNDCEVLK